MKALRIKKTSCFFAVALFIGMAVSYAEKGKSPDEKTVPKALELSQEDISKARASNIKSVPKIKADYVFGANKLLTGWEGMPGMEKLKDYFGSGENGVKFQPKGLFTSRIGPVLYWKLTGIKPGTYYPCLWLETGHERVKKHEPHTYDSEYDPSALLTTIYLNGWPVRFSTTSDPVQVKPGLWLGELQSGKPVKLKDGDEIAISIPCNVWGGYTAKILRLALYSKEPSRGHGVTGRTFGVRPGTLQRVRLVLEPKIIGNGKDGSEHKARILVANPLPYAVDALIDWKLADYYGSPLVEKTEEIHLEPHKSKLISYPFKTRGDARAYQLDVKSRPAEGFSFPVPRPTELLELSDYSRMEFLPNQPDPLTVWGHTRMDLNDDRSGGRKYLSLSGSAWESAWLKGRTVPETIPTNLVFKPGKRPVKAADGKQRFGKWLRKKFKVPSWMRGEKYLIEVSEFASEATVFLNGKRIGYQKSQVLPIIVDATSALNLEGENELVICLRGLIALLKSDYVDKFDNAKRVAAKDQMNHAGSSRRGYDGPLIKDVFLRAVPGVRVAQTLIIPDVEKETIKIMTRIENLDDRKRDIDIEFAIFQKGKKIPLDIPKIKTSVESGAKKEFVVNVDMWKSKNHKLLAYTPKKPILAKLVTSIVEKEKTVDVFEQRFAYRTVKVNGTELTLNGKNFKLFGCAYNYLPRILEGEDSLKLERKWNSHRPQWGMEMYDEIGLFTHPNNELHGCHDWNLLRNDHFWKTMRDFQVELIWLLGSHPSAIAWDVCNESHYGVRHRVGKEGVLKVVDHIADCAEEVQKKVFPDFWFIANGDEDLEKRINYYSFHYLNQYRGKSITYPEGYDKSVYFYPPDSFYFNNRSSAPPRKGEQCRKPYVTGNRWTFGEKAIGDTETLWFNDELNGPSAARQVGDKATVSTAWQFQTARGMSHTKMTIDACRDMEMPYIAYVTWKDFFTVTTQDIAFSMPEQQIRYYSGSEFNRRLNIHDDEFSPGNLEFRWSLIDPNGKTVRDGRIKLKSDTSTMKRDKITFEIPTVSEKSEFRLKMDLLKDGKKKAYEDRIVEVWPKLDEMPTPLKDIVVYDPKKSISTVLQEFGYTFKSIEKLDDAALQGAKGLIIGTDAAYPAMFASDRPVRNMVERGGHLLLLNQKQGALTELGIEFDPKAWFSVGFIRAPEHPLMNGLRDMDFQMWNPDHLICRGAYKKPKTGAFMTLLDSCFNTRMDWTPLVELYVGKGSILASQLPLVKDFKNEPMCAEMLKRMVSYLTQPIFRRPEKELSVLEGANSPALKRLGDVRADFKIVKNLDAKNPVSLVDLSGKGRIPDADAVKSYLKEGGTLIVHRVSPKDKNWLESVLSKPVSIQVQPYKCWADRLMLERRNGLVSGISNLDLYWRTLVRGGHLPATNQVSSAPIKELGQVNYLVEVDGFEDYFFPGGLLEIPVGEGKLVIDQLNWSMDSKGFVCGSPRRMLSMLLTNLGVKFNNLERKKKRKLVLPKGVVYETIDLASKANLSLKDDTPQDGEGWCDWGPEKILKGFPTGKVKLKGVPYNIPDGEKNAVALRVNPKWLPHLEKHPSAVIIHLNKKHVAGLLFLHVGGWANKNDDFGERRIKYTDGTEVIIPLNSTNVADWNYGRDEFPDEIDTQTTVAWKGKGEERFIPRVYQTLWLNPHPEKTIKYLMLANQRVLQRNRRFISHFAITAAMFPSKSEGNIELSSENVEKSRNLFEAARKLVREGKDQKAVEKLEEALKVDRRNINTWALLGSIYSRTYDIARYENFHRVWVATTPKCSRAWDILGEFYEGKNEKRKALEAYKKSLGINWNQLDILEKVHKLEKELESDGDKK